MKYPYNSPAWVVYRHPEMFQKVRAHDEDIYIMDSMGCRPSEFDKHFWVTAKEVDEVRAFYERNAV